MPDASDLSAKEQDISLDHLSDEELEELLFDEEEADEGIWNLPTIAGLALITVGIVYLFERLGFLAGFSMEMLSAMLPWLAGILIILIGFGVLSWRPRKKKARTAPSLQDIDLDEPAKKKATQELLRKQLQEKQAVTGKKRLRRARFDKKIAGVCGGIADYLNIDSTLVRLIFVVGTIASAGTFIPLYIALWIIMPKPETLTPEERITIIRDS